MEVSKFIEDNFNSKEEFFFTCAKSLFLLPLDAFDLIKYKYGHLTLAKQHFLLEKEREELIPYALCWEISKLFSNFSTNTITREEAYNQLLEYLELSPLSQAQMTLILVLDNINQELTLGYLQKAVELIGLHSAKFTLIYNLFTRHLLKR